MRKYGINLYILSCILLLPVSAHAGTTSVINDCIDGSLEGHYSHAELSKAKKAIPDDIAEYTNCLDAIDRYGTGKLPAKRPGQVAPGVDPNGIIKPSHQRAKQLKKAAKSSKGPIQLGGEKVVVGSASPLFKKAGFIFNLPWQAAILIGIMALGIAAGVVGKINLGRVKRFFGR